MDTAIESGRSAFGRSPAGVCEPDDLAQTFARLPRELGLADGMAYCVIRGGRARPLRPFVRGEAYRIGHQALVNAFRNSGATEVEVRVEYADRCFRVLVRDNGRVMDPRVSWESCEGHGGLVGMREGAERIGGRLRVRRHPAGTEIDLYVPKRVAYRRPAAAASPRSEWRFRRSGTL